MLEKKDIPKGAEECAECDGTGSFCKECEEGEVFAQDLAYTPSGMGGPHVESEGYEECGECGGDWKCPFCDGRGYLPPDKDHFESYVKEEDELVEKLLEYRREGMESILAFRPIINEFINSYLVPWDITFYLSPNPEWHEIVTLNISVESFKSLNVTPYLRFLTEAGLKIRHTNAKDGEISWNFSLRDREDLSEYRNFVMKITGENCRRVPDGVEEVQKFKTICE